MGIAISPKAAEGSTQDRWVSKSRSSLPGITSTSRLTITSSRCQLRSAQPLLSKTQTMTVDDWLKAACEDAERRGLPELKPFLESLARSMAALREADRLIDRGHDKS